VPILLTRQGHAERLGDDRAHLIARIDPEDSKKIDLIARTVKDNVDLDAVYSE